MFVKIINLLNKRGYIKENIFSLLMNLKERGITVGDLLIFLILILISTILIKSFKKDNKKTLNHSNHEYIAYRNPYFQKIF